VSKVASKEKKGLGLALFASLALVGVLIAAGFSKDFLGSTVFRIIVGGGGLGVVGLLVWRTVLGARRKPVLEYLSGAFVLAGLLGIIAAAAWSFFFSVHEDITISEGDAVALPFEAGDSLHLYKFRLTFYPRSEPRSVSDHQALVETLIEGIHAWDTIGLSTPLRRAGRRIHLIDYDISEDSAYLLWDFLMPWGDTISYESPTEGVIDDPLVPLIVAFEDFYIDRTHVWPTPEVPVVTVSLMLPGKLLARKKMRAPDTISAEGYTLIFQGLRMRITNTFHCVRDPSWIAALAGGAFVLAGLAMGSLVRMRRNFGRRDV